MKYCDHIPEILLEDLKNRLDAFHYAADKAGVKLESNPVFAFSSFIAMNCARSPKMAENLVKSKDLEREYTPGEYAGIVKEALKDVKDHEELKAALKERRTREMVRIAWRDISGMTDLFQTMADLSEFAQACIDETFSVLYDQLCEKFGTPTTKDGLPQDIIVLAMGKLGACELNFSSDVDLIFAYPEPGETEGGKKQISNEEFFTRLCRNFLNIFEDTTPDGIIFRIDLRLRPFGENGPLVMSSGAMEEYYQNQGREWERYALIKARAIAGDKLAGKQLLQTLNPFIYRRYLDFGVYNSLREMKHKIELEIRRGRFKDNIKLGAGGIREVEFFGQIFQLIRGGVEPELQKRGILKVLEALCRLGYIPGKVYDELKDAYIFLRKTENRLQEFSDQQTHNLPADDLGKARLAASIGYNNWESYAKELEKHMKRVHFHFNQLLADKKDSEPESLSDDLYEVWNGDLTKEEAEKILSRAGFEQADEVYASVEFLRNDFQTRSLSREGRNQLDRLMPLVLKETGNIKQSAQVIKRLVDLIKTIERRTCYISLLLENHDVLTYLISVSNDCPWIISYVAKHPVLLDELIDVESLYIPPKREELEKSLQKRIESAPAQGLELQMEELIIFKQINTLRVAAADMAGAFPLMKISDYLTDIAETILKQVFKLSYKHLTKKHGTPVCMLDKEACEEGFAIIAYGKLGGYELGYGSDLDLVFLHAGTMEETRGGKKPIDTNQFYARLGQRILHLLTTYTPAGRLYEIDMRLRPGGSSGVLVSNIESFNNYVKKEAGTWEHLALSRARAICGDKNIIDYFEKLRIDILSLPRKMDVLNKDAASMRNRILKEHQSNKTEEFNIKHDKGGLIDIEFIVQYLILLNAHKDNKLTRWPDIIRQLEALSKASILEARTADFLKNAYITYRTEVHRLSLKEKPPIVIKDKYKELSDRVTKIWNSLFAGSLHDEAGC